MFRARGLGKFRVWGSFGFLAVPKPETKPRFSAATATPENVMEALRTQGCAIIEELKSQIPLNPEPGILNNKRPEALKLLEGSAPKKPKL